MTTAEKADKTTAAGDVAPRSGETIRPRPAPDASSDTTTKPTRAGLAAIVFRRADVAIVCAGLAFAGTLFAGKGISHIDQFPILAPIEPHLSKLAFAALTVAAIALARWRDRLRDPVTIAAGAAWLTWVGSLKLVGVVLASALIVHFVAHRLKPHLGALFAAVTFFAFVYFVHGPPDVASVHGDTPEIVRAIIEGNVATANMLGVMGIRFLIYGYESRAVARKRSLLSWLAFGPFNVFMMRGELPWFSYVDYVRPRPREQLTKLGTTQLYRSAFKLALITAMLKGAYLLFPSGHALLERFPHLSLPAQIGIILPIAVIWFLRLSMSADVVCGLSNLAGYHAPDAFDWPLLSNSPFEFWRRWNIQVLQFVRVFWIYPVARKRRSLLLIIVAGMGGTILVHSFQDIFNPMLDLRRTPYAPIVDNIVNFWPMTALLFAFAPLEKRSIKAGIAGVVVTQLVFAAKVFSPAFLYGDVEEGRTDRCALISIFVHKDTCDLPPLEPPPEEESPRSDAPPPTSAAPPP